MVLPPNKPVTPGCQGHTKYSVYKTCMKNKLNCNKCMRDHLCKECQYWPIYPCYSPERPMIHCLEEYDNDSVVPDTSKPMYDRSKMEGHDARLLRQVFHISRLLRKVKYLPKETKAAK